jgi:circadian clock protein KaiC
MGVTLNLIRLYPGIPSLDNILLRSQPSKRAYLVEGDSCTGKGTLGTRFILEGKQRDERSVNVTLTESNSLT